VKIVAVDPGGTTGLCLVNESGEILDSAEIKPLADVMKWLRESSPDHLVVEDFFGGVMRNYKDPVMVIGIAHLFSQETNTPITMQSPAILPKWTKKVASVPGRHIRSALSHALHFLDKST